MARRQLKCSPLPASLISMTRRRIRSSPEAITQSQKRKRAGADALLKYMANERAKFIERAWATISFGHRMGMTK